MWYKIEVGSDGGILSCTEVEASIASGRYVRYVGIEPWAAGSAAFEAWRAGQS